MNMEQIIKRLKEPFSFNQTEWKVQASNQEKTRGLAVVYIDSRAIQNRLDDVVGPLNWRNEYISWQDKAQICGISIYDGDRGIWVTKYDGAENTDYEPIKGGLSDSFKRAAVIWGLGRYLYDIESIWVDIETKGKSSIIRDSEMKKLENHYNKLIANPANNSEAKQEPSPNSSASPKNQSGSKTQAQNQQPSSESSYDYEIKSKTQSGSSMCLKLVDNDGKELVTFVKDDKPDLKPGARIRNAQMEQKEANFGIYYVLNNYDVAA